MLRSKTAPTRLCAAFGPYAAHALALGAGGVFSAAVLPGGAAPLGLALTIGILFGIYSSGLITSPLIM